MIHILGMTDTGQLLAGGFYTAHTSHGMTCDWFMPMFLTNGFSVSIPYFAAECLQHPNEDPDSIWPMLESAYSEAHIPFDVESEKMRLNAYLALRWTQMGKPTLREMSIALMSEQRKNGEAFNAWSKSVSKIVSSANQISPVTVQTQRSA